MPEGESIDRHAWAYHEATSYERSQMDGHFLDWDNQPHLFKTYSDREPVDLYPDLQEATPEQNILLSKCGLGRGRLSHPGYWGAFVRLGDYRQGFGDFVKCCFLLK